MTGDEQAERTVFVSCVCTFDDTCRVPFTIAITPADLDRIRATGRWPRSCGAHPTVREAKVAADVAAKAARRRQREVVGDVFVSGRCRRSTCRRPYTVVMKAMDLAQGTGNMPRSCSPECGRALKRDKYQQSKQRRELAEQYATAYPVTDAPTVVWPVPCRACWLNKPAKGEVMCDWCQQTARRCCFGKSRYDKVTADKRARVVSDSSGDTIVPYRCPMCEEWHIGHLLPAFQYKKVRFAVAMYREMLSPEEWRSICASFAPLSNAAIKNRARQYR